MGKAEWTHGKASTMNGGQLVVFVLVGIGVEGRASLSNVRGSILAEFDTS